jgi:hypothetical protein
MLSNFYLNIVTKNKWTIICHSEPNVAISISLSWIVFYIPINKERNDHTHLSCCHLFFFWNKKHYVLPIFTHHTYIPKRTVNIYPIVNEKWLCISHLGMEKMKMHIWNHPTYFKPFQYIIHRYQDIPMTSLTFVSVERCL